MVSDLPSRYVEIGEWKRKLSLLSEVCGMIYSGCLVDVMWCCVSVVCCVTISVVLCCVLFFWCDNVSVMCQSAVSFPSIHPPNGLHSLYVGKELCCLFAPLVAMFSTDYYISGIASLKSDLVSNLRLHSIHQKKIGTGSPKETLGSVQHRLNISNKGTGGVWSASPPEHKRTATLLAAKRVGLCDPLGDPAKNHKVQGLKLKTKSSCFWRLRIRKA